MGAKTRILHITLKKKWFDMTDSGEKPEEYREITPYWISRLCIKTDSTVCDFFHNDTGYNFKRFDTVFARNGYNTKSPTWRRRYVDTLVRGGDEKWGAEPGKMYFVIKLGESHD